MPAPARRSDNERVQAIEPCHVLLVFTRSQIQAASWFAAPPVCRSGRDRFLIGSLPAPGAGAVAALDDALLVDLRDDFAVAGKQRLGRAHLGTQRQLAFGEPVRAVLLILGLG